MKAARAVSLPYVRHPWPFPSALSLLGCLARVNVLEPRDVAALFTQNPAHVKSVADSLGSLHKAGRFQIEQRTVEETLRLRPSELTLAFESRAWWPRALQPLFSKFGVTNRFCLECLKQGFHSHLLDLPWMLRCPLHGVDLCTSCPHCGGKIQGLSHPSNPIESFTCTRCRRVLAREDAIVMATHASAGRLNEVVAAHFQWCRDISGAFTVAPICPGGRIEHGHCILNSLISASGVDWPKALAPYVASSQERLPGISRSWLISGKAEVDQLSQVSRMARDASIASYALFPCSPSQSRWLIKLDRRLQEAAGLSESPALRDRVNFARRSKKLDAMTPQEREALTHRPQRIDYSIHSSQPESIPGRGYSSRAVTISVSTNLVGDTSLTVVRGKWSDLDCIKLLGCVAMIRQSPEVHEEAALVEVVSWWYEHLLALALIESTAAAIYMAALSAPAGYSQSEAVHEWPVVDMNQGRPSRSWMLTAITANNQLTAHLVSVPIPPIRDRDLAEYRMLRASLARSSEAAVWLMRKRREATSDATE